MSRAVLLSVAFERFVARCIASKDEESSVLGAGRLHTTTSHIAKLPPQNTCPAPEDRCNKQGSAELSVIASLRTGEIATIHVTIDRNV
eukprot:scaffold2464_cov96-Skeletonema_dohrnii-CCMP3373.AAC.5